MQNQNSQTKFITIFNRDINLSSVNSIFMNKDGYEIVFSLDHVSSSKDSQVATGELIHWYLEDEYNYRAEGGKLIEQLKASGMFIVPCSDEANRLDIINKDNVSYIKYDSQNNKITFNFKNSVFRRGLWVSDFIHWKFSNYNNYLVEEANVVSKLQ